MQDDDDLVIGCNFYLSAISSTTYHGLLNIWHKWWAKIFVINTDVFLYGLGYQINIIDVYSIFVRLNMDKGSFVRNRNSINFIQLKYLLPKHQHIADCITTSTGHYLQGIIFSCVTLFGSDITLVMLHVLFWHYNRDFYFLPLRKYISLLWCGIIHHCALYYYYP